MPVPDAAVAHYAAQRTIVETVSQRLQELWKQLDPTALDDSWIRGQVGEEIFVTIALGQQSAAGSVDEYLTAVLAEQGIGTASGGAVQARAFAGIASDGRNLESLLYEPVITAKAAFGAGASVGRGLAIGASLLDTIAKTQVADAGRTAVGTAIVAHHDVTTWTRMLNPPSCSRCIVLAGKVYRYNRGFLRHPHCNCVHIPSIESVAGDTTTDPKAYFDSLSLADQAKYFTEAGAQAIRDGADIGQVVNVRRKGAMYQANGQGFTVAGTTKRGAATGLRRPLPETIYENADSRADAIEQLRTFGYLV